MQNATPQSSEPDMRTEMRLYRKAFSAVEPRFNPARADRDTLNSLFAWVWRIDDINKLGLDYGKGFFLYGNLGLGKSMTLEVLRQYMNGVVARHDSKRNDYRMKAWKKSASELANIYAADGQPALIKYAEEGVNLIIDEFGREPNPAKYFGTEQNVIQFLLQLRYDHRHDSVTHITTNLQLDDIAGLYGSYVADRCLEMFNFIEFKGDSIRQGL